MSPALNVGRVVVLRLGGADGSSLGSAYAGTLVRFTVTGDNSPPGRTVEFSGETSSSRTFGLDAAKLVTLAPLLTAFCARGNLEGIADVAGLPPGALS